MKKPDRELVCHTIVLALTSPTECTLAQLIADYGLVESDILAAVSYVKEVANYWQLECNPPIGVGGLEDIRVLKRKSGPGNLEIAFNEIKGGENDKVEFKETLCLDVRKFESTKELSQCYSEDVIHSSLKTIAAFLNTGGGILYIGVKDNGFIAGIDCEFGLIPLKGKQDLDGWQLYFWSQIEKYFAVGKSISSYLRIEIMKINDVNLARIVVGQRDRIAFLKKGGSDVLYLRSGNRTLSIPYGEIEDHFILSRR